MFQKNVVEKMKTHISCPVTSVAVYVIMLKKYG
jgi:hypothetical protein